MTRPTLILKTTRIGSRSAVQRLNQSLYMRKGEPKRRKAGVGPCPPRIVEPGAKTVYPGKPWTDASLLLVILHYLLKNNTEFMMGYGQVPTPPGGIEAGVTVKSSMSPPEGRWGV